MASRQYIDDQVAVARLRFTRIPPRKARAIVDLIRGKSVAEATAILRLTHRPSAAPQIHRLLKSAISNAQAAADRSDVSDLRIARAWVDGGAQLKRWRPRAMGRAAPIRKRTCHVTLVLGQPE